MVYVSINLGGNLTCSVKFKRKYKPISCAARNTTWTPIDSCTKYFVRHRPTTLQKSRILFGTTPISFSNMYKPGGTAHIVGTGDITGRIIHQESDKWGRWVSLTFRGQALISLTVVSAYQVVGKPTNPGCITAASQQQSLLLQSEDATSNPRTAFRQDLLTFLRMQRAKDTRYY